MTKAPSTHTRTPTPAHTQEKSKSICVCRLPPSRLNTFFSMSSFNSICCTNHHSSCHFRGFFFFFFYLGVIWVYVTVGTHLLQVQSHPLSPWAFTSSYAKHVLLSSNSSTVCCCDTFFLHFSLTETFMFICSVQLCSIWRDRFPFFPPLLFFHLFPFFFISSPDKKY